MHFPKQLSPPPHRNPVRPVCSALSSPCFRTRALPNLRLQNQQPARNPACLHQESRQLRSSSRQFHRPRLRAHPRPSLQARIRLQSRLFITSLRASLPRRARRPPALRSPRQAANQEKAKKICKNQKRPSMQKKNKFSMKNSNQYRLPPSRRNLRARPHQSRHFPHCLPPLLRAQLCRHQLLLLQRALH